MLSYVRASACCLHLLDVEDGCEVGVGPSTALLTLLEEMKENTLLPLLDCVGTGPTAAMLRVLQTAI